MGQTNEFTASSLIVRQAVRVRFYTFNTVLIRMSLFPNLCHLVNPV
jgi:hypothetical protein